MKRIKQLLILICVSILTACQTEDSDTKEQLENTAENVQDASGADELSEICVPTKEQVVAARETVLEGMTAEQIERLTENIKVANLQMEQAYLYDNIFGELEDTDSLYWNYFDQKGDIQIYIKYDGTPVEVYNRFDADNFVNLIAEMQESVQNEALREDLQKLIDETVLAKETHDVEHANNIYKILHDMDYYLLRYGLEDVGIYVKDASTLAQYYGVLTVYGQGTIN